MNRSRTGLITASVAVLATAVLAGCGSSDDDSDSGSASSGGSAAERGGEAADESLDPVTVGFHNLEGGALSVTDVRYGFEAGVDYVNSELGGINGHPLEYISCDVDVTPESSVACANRFVDEGVVMAVQGIDFAGDAGLPILQQAGIVDVSAFAYGAAANVAEGDFYASEQSQQEGYAGPLVQLHDLGNESVAYVLADLASSRASMSEVAEPAAEELGLDLQPYFYTPGADWTTFAATVLSDDPEAVALFATEADCLGAIPALRSAGFTGDIMAGTCTGLLTALDPSSLSGVIFANAFYNETVTPLPDGAKEQLDIFNEYMDANHPDFENVNQAMQGFHVAIFAADLLRTVPGDDFTAQAVKDNVGTASGDLFFRTNGFDCSQPTWPGTTACGSGMIFSQVNDSGENEILPDQPLDVSAVIPSA